MIFKEVKPEPRKVVCGDLSPLILFKFKYVPFRALMMRTDKGYLVLSNGVHIEFNSADADDAIYMEVEVWRVVNDIEVTVN